MYELLIPAFIALAVLIILAALIWTLLTKIVGKVLALAINSAGAIALLLSLHYFFAIGIPINLPTLIITIIFGFAGVGSLLVLYLFGII
jgi:hypothetical protein